MMCGEKDPLSDDTIIFAVGVTLMMMKKCSELYRYRDA